MTEMNDTGMYPRRRRSMFAPVPASLTPQPVRAFAPSDHVSTEAIAAFVDGELRMNAHLRAARHCAECTACAAEVEAQQAARAALRESASRQSAQITAPLDLLGQLSSIPSREFDMPSAVHPHPSGFPVHRIPRRRSR